MLFCVYSPLHDDEQALLALVDVLVQTEDLDDVGSSWHTPMELNLPPGFGTVVQNLTEKDGGRKGESIVIKDFLIQHLQWPKWDH